jgi:4-phytase/acid phosphatase
LLCLDRRLHPARLAALLCCLVISSACLGQAPSEGDDEVRAVIVVARHGVRAPIESEIRGSFYNGQPWPAWPAAEGVLTEHGTEAMKLMADFYHRRYPALFPQSCDDSGIYVESTTAQRAIASAKAVLTVLAPRCSVEIHTGQQKEQPSPFRSTMKVDRQRLTDAWEGRIGNHPEWFVKSFSVPLAEMHHVLVDCSGKDCDLTKPDFRTINMESGLLRPRNPRFDTPVTLGADFAEHFLLEYTEGMPMEDVGWGRVSRETLDRLMEMNTRSHDFNARTPYGAEVSASILASRIRDTVVAASDGRSNSGSLGQPGDHFFYLSAHDGNVASLGSLLRLDWLVQDQALNATPPGGAMVFELHRNRISGAHTIRTLFISQTLDQLRYLRPLKGGEQPSISNIFVPGCSGAGPNYECTIEGFSKVVTTMTAH